MDVDVNMDEDVHMDMEIDMHMDIDTYKCTYISKIVAFLRFKRIF
jgi:hypothetical protein